MRPETNKATISAKLKSLIENGANDSGSGDDGENARSSMNQGSLESLIKPGGSEDVLGYVTNGCTSCPG